MTKVLLDHGFQKVDFISLDVEGFIQMVLHALDLKKVDASALLVEARTAEHVQYLEKFGYATLMLTSVTDGMRGYYGDVLAWKPERFPSICSYP